MKRYLRRIWHHSATLNNETLAAHIEEVESSKVLDVGCGNGYVLMEMILKDRIANPRVYGLEINKKSGKEAEKRGIKVSLSSAEKRFPFPSNSFDLVIANQIIEHLVEIDDFVDELYRVLKPKGFLLLSTENLSSWHNIFALLLGWHPFSDHISAVKNRGNPLRLTKSEDFSQEETHVKIFTPKALKELMRLHNFKIENYFGSGYYPMSGGFSKALSRIDPIHTAFIGVKARKLK